MWTKAINWLEANSFLKTPDLGEGEVRSDPSPPVRNLPARAWPNPRPFRFGAILLARNLSRDELKVEKKHHGALFFGNIPPVLAFRLKKRKITGRAGASYFLRTFDGGVGI
jgi:hypothetical protein